MNETPVLAVIGGSGLYNFRSQRYYNPRSGYTLWETQLTDHDREIRG
jgi:purine nucleoside phosphorylase